VLFRSGPVQVQAHIELSAQGFEPAYVPGPSRRQRHHAGGTQVPGTGQLGNALGRWGVQRKVVGAKNESFHGRWIVARGSVPADFAGMQAWIVPCPSSWLAQRGHP